MQAARAARRSRAAAGERSPSGRSAASSASTRSSGSRRSAAPSGVSTPGSRRATGARGRATPASGRSALTSRRSTPASHRSTADEGEAAVLPAARRRGLPRRSLPQARKAPVVVEERDSGVRGQSAAPGRGERKRPRPGRSRSLEPLTAPAVAAAAPAEPTATETSGVTAPAGSAARPLRRSLRRSEVGVFSSPLERGVLPGSLVISYVTEPGASLASLRRCQAHALTQPLREALFRADDEALAESLRVSAAALRHAENWLRKEGLVKEGAGAVAAGAANADGGGGGADHGASATSFDGSPPRRRRRLSLPWPRRRGGRFSLPAVPGPRGPGRPSAAAAGAVVAAAAAAAAGAAAEGAAWPIVRRAAAAASVKALAAVASRRAAEAATDLLRAEVAAKTAVELWRVSVHAAAAAGSPSPAAGGPAAAGAPAGIAAGPGALGPAASDPAGAGGCELSSGGGGGGPVSHQTAFPLSRSATTGASVAAENEPLDDATGDESVGSPRVFRGVTARAPAWLVPGGVSSLESSELADLLSPEGAAGQAAMARGTYVQLRDALLAKHAAYPALPVSVADCALLAPAVDLVHCLRVVEFLEAHGALRSGRDGSLARAPSAASVPPAPACIVCEKVCRAKWYRLASAAAGAGGGAGGGRACWCAECFSAGLYGSEFSKHTDFVEEGGGVTGGQPFPPVVSASGANPEPDFYSSLNRRLVALGLLAGPQTLGAVASEVEGLVAARLAEHQVACRAAAPVSPLGGALPSD